MAAVIETQAQTAVREPASAEEQRLPRVANLPRTLDAQQRELAAMARANEPLSGQRFQLHTANALYLAQEELERRMSPAGGIENKLPKMSRSKAVRSLMDSEYFGRFCANQKDAEGMARLFEGEMGAMNAMRQFGAAIRQVEREKNLRQSAPEPARQIGGALPEQSM